MADFPNTNNPDTCLPLFISTSSFLANGLSLSSIGSVAASASTLWTTANSAVYIPLYLPFPYPVNRVFWQNGSAAGGNWDFGIYTIGGARLFSTGSTAGSGNSAPQFVTPGTPFILAPGRYFIALNHSATTANHSFGFTVTTSQARLCGIYSQAVGAIALPQPATFATATTTHVPVCGITRTTTGF